MEFQKIKIYLNSILLSILFTACGSEPVITPEMLEGDVLFDASLYTPEQYLVSQAIPSPDANQAQTPVLIVAHGYTATTFEWDELRDWNNNNGNPFLLSQVLLGGHGRTYDEFKQSTWEDWRSPIIDEYEKLVAAGYQNISFAGSSTGGALLIQIIESGYFNGKQAPNEFFLVDPIVIPSSKILSIVGLVGPMLGYVESGNTPEEEPYWYHFRPQETLQQLQKLLTVIRKSLEDGIVLPIGSNLKVYKSISDGSADPASAVLIYKGMSKSDGNKIDVEMIDSDLHVYTRLNLRKDLTQKDYNNQLQTFEDFVFRLGL